MDGNFSSLEKEGVPRPLPEDYAMRGFIYAEDYYPEKLFMNEKIDEDEKYITHINGWRTNGANTVLDCKIAPQDQWLTYTPVYAIFPWMNQMLRRESCLSGRTRTEFPLMAI